MRNDEPAAGVRFVFGVTAASRNTRFQAARYGLTRAGLAPADRASFCWRLPSFDHLIGRYEQGLRQREAQSLGGLEIDRELELARLFDRNIGDFDALSLTTKQASSSSSIVHGGGKRRGEGITKISRR